MYALFSNKIEMSSQFHPLAHECCTTSDIYFLGKLKTFAAKASMCSFSIYNMYNMHMCVCALCCKIILNVGGIEATESL